MKVVTNSFPKASRPGEYVAFFNLKIPTKEGAAFVYLACDAYSEFGLNIGVESDENPDTILKNIYLLTEDKNFSHGTDKGFTLVLDRFEELTDQINAIINSINGKIMFDKAFHKQIARPMLKSLSQFIEPK